MPEFKRSRLQRQEDEQITKKTITLGIATLLMFGLVIAFGLPFLVKFSIFLGETKNRMTNDTAEKVLPPQPPRLIIPFEATNSAEIVIKGYAEPQVEVELLKNDVAVARNTVSENGDFEFEDIFLDEGENLFASIAIGKDGGSSEVSKSIIVSLDKTPPEISMINPGDDSVTVDVADFEVVGKSERGVSVLINNNVAMVDDEGQFKLKIQLNSGNNDIEVKARDLGGNETKKYVKIKYDI